MGIIKKQSINNSIFSYIGALLGFALIYIQPKLISSSDIGLLRLMFSFAWICATIMPLGIGSITMRFFPRIRNESNGHNGFFLLLFLVVTGGALLVGGILFFFRSNFLHYYNQSAEFANYFPAAILMGYTVSLISMYNLYSISLLRTTYTVFLTDIFTRACQLLLVLAFSSDIISKRVFVLAYVFIFVAQLILMMIYLYKIKAISFKINWAAYKTFSKWEIISVAGLMVITSFASLGIKFVDQLMIGKFLSEAAVGIYATSVMICVVMEIPFNSLDRIAQPKIAEAWSLSRTQEITNIYEMSSRYMFYLGAVLFCLLWSGIDLFYEFIPAEYAEGKMAFYIMSVSSLLNLLTGVNSTIITLSHKYFVSSLLLLTLIAVALIANNIFIEPFGITGAAIASLISIGAFNILKYLYILIRFKMQPFSTHTLYITLSLLLCISLILVSSLYFNPFLKAVVGSSFTVIVFSAINIKFNMIPEINKVFRRFRIIK